MLLHLKKPVQLCPVVTVDIPSQKFREDVKKRAEKPTYRSQVSRQKFHVNSWNATKALFLAMQPNLKEKSLVTNLTGFGTKFAHEVRNQRRINELFHNADGFRLHLYERDQGRSSMCKFWLTTFIIPHCIDVKEGCRISLAYKDDYDEARDASLRYDTRYATHSTGQG